jgi:hypothetical protein
MAEGRPAFDPRRILAVLDRHRVDYVLIGGLAAVLHGAPHPTGDVDITLGRHRRNLARLSPALTELRARMRFPGRPDGLVFTHDQGSLGRMFAAMQSVNLVTPHGPLDIVVEPPGMAGYRDLRRNAVGMRFEGVPVQVAALDDLIRCKEATHRPKDLEVLPALRRLLEGQELDRALRIEPRLQEQDLEPPGLAL